MYVNVVWGIEGWRKRRTEKVRSEKAKDSSRYQKTITTTTCIFTFYHSVPRNKVTIGDFIVGKIEGR